MRRYYCTFFDRNYLVRGLALIDSLQRHERHQFTVFAVCLDELTRIALARLAHSHVVVIPLHQLEARNEPLLSAKLNRSHMEYCWTLTSTVIAWLLDRHPAIDILTYLDADLYFFSSPDPLFQELGTDAVLIHGHRYSAKMYDYLTRQCNIADPNESYGSYNVGLVSFRNNEEGKRVANWWRDRCLEWCYQHVEPGRYGDQRYLNDWPDTFPAVHVLANIGGGVAPWNIDGYGLSAPSGVVSVDGVPVIFYHFHSLKIFSRQVVVPAWYPQYNPISEELLQLCVLPYVKILFQMLAKLQSVLPDYHWGVIHDTAPPKGRTLVCTMETFIALKQMLDREGEQYLEIPLQEGSWGALTCQGE